MIPFVKSDNLKTMLEEFDLLHLPVADYIIAGSGPMGIRGIREIRDLDIVVSDELWELLSDKYAIIDGGDPGTKKIVISEVIEVLGTPSFTYDDLFTPKVNELIEEAEMIDGHPYMSLSHLIFFKCKKKRDKDLRDVSMIYEWLKKNGQHL